MPVLSHTQGYVVSILAQLYEGTAVLLQSEYGSLWAMYPPNIKFKIAPPESGWIKIADHCPPPPPPPPIKGILDCPL